MIIYFADFMICYSLHNNNSINISVIGQYMKPIFWHYFFQFFEGENISAQNLIFNSFKIMATHFF